MQLKITYDDALDKYPIFVDEVISKIRKSKNKYKNCCGEEMEWFYNYSVKLGENEVIFICLLAKIGQWKGYSSLFKKIPEEVQSKLNGYP